MTSPTIGYHVALEFIGIGSQLARYAQALAWS